MSGSLRDRLSQHPQERRRVVPADDNGQALPVEVEVLNMRLHGKGTMLAFLDLEMRIAGVGVRLNDCVLHEKEGRSWVNLPSKQYTARDGTTKYAPLVQLDETTYNTFQTASVRAVETYTPEAEG